MSTPPAPPSGDDHEPQGPTDQPAGSQPPGDQPAGGDASPAGGGAPVWGGGSQQPGGAPSGGTPTSGASTGLEPNVAALLSYVLGWVTGLIFYFIEKENQEVRFHAAQSIVVFGAFSILWVVLSFLVVIPVVNLIIVFVVWPLLGLLSVFLWVYLMIQGYQLKHTKIPIAGNYAETLAAKQV